MSRRRAMVRTALENSPLDKDDLRHIHSVLAICGLPYTRQPIEIREFERRQGRMSLVVEAGKLRNPETGDRIAQPLPFGPKSRLLLLHLCSEAIRQKSATMEIADSLTGFIRDMGFAVTGGKRGTINAFKEQINALAACKLSVGMWDGIRAVEYQGMPFSKIDVWLPTNPDQLMLWPSTLTFSMDFFTTLSRHALPIRAEAVRAFAGSARKLDMYFWFNYRLQRLKEPTTLVLGCHRRTVRRRLRPPARLQARFRRRPEASPGCVPETACKALRGRFGGASGRCRRPLIAAAPAAPDLRHAELVAPCG